MATHLRAYAVGAAFSVRDVDDENRWRPTDRYWSDVYYGPRQSGTPQPTSDNGRRRSRRAPSPVRTTVDASRIRTPEQRRAAALRAINS